MAVTTDDIENQIDSNLPDNFGRGNKAVTVRNLLKIVVRWVASVANTTMNSWYKVGTSTTPAGNADAVYRTGRMLIGRTTDDTSNHQVQVQGGVNVDFITVVTLNVNGRMSSTNQRFPAFYSVNTDGANPPAISELGSAQMAIGANMTSGFLDCSFINTNLQGNGFAWFQMLTGTTKRFLMFLTGSGKLGIGTVQPYDMLDVAGNAQVQGFLRTGGGNKAFKITGTKAASGLSLKTDRYLELLLEDGTIVKVAEVN